MNNDKKAYVLFSGGLDSMLAVCVLEDQGFLVKGVCFESNFYNADKAREVAKKIGIELIIVDISKEVLTLVKNPPHGLGKNMNPCIDCHALMIKKVGEMANIAVVATGEVLGQRPFSQNKNALEKVKNISGVDVLRPLSAKLLSVTEIEKRGLVDREKLYSIQGRRRDGQKELLEKFKIKEYPTPAGGCLLTDPEFSNRLKEMIKHWPNCSIGDVALLKFGRVFWANVKDSMVLLVIGRHQDDNDMLEKLAKEGDIVVKLKNDKGATAVIRGIVDYKRLAGSCLQVQVLNELNLAELDLVGKKNEEEFIEIAAKMTGYFAPKLRGVNVEFLIKF